MICCLSAEMGISRPPARTVISISKPPCWRSASCSTMRRTRARRYSSSKGLVIKLSAPCSRPKRISAGARRSVSSTKGSRRVAGAAFTA